MSKPFNIHDWQHKQRKQLLNEHHDDEDFPGKNLSAWDLLDKIKANDQELYDRVEAFMKQIEEASMTGTGASITTGDSMAYATPKAFKKKNKED